MHVTIIHVGITHKIREIAVIIFKKKKKRKAYPLLSFQSIPTSRLGMQFIAIKMTRIETIGKEIPIVFRKK